MKATQRSTTWEGSNEKGTLALRKENLSPPFDSPAVSVNSSHSFDDGALSLIETKGQVLVFHARLKDFRTQTRMCGGHSWRETQRGRDLAFTEQKGWKNLLITRLILKYNYCESTFSHSQVEIPCFGVSKLNQLDVYARMHLVHACWMKKM